MIETSAPEAAAGFCVQPLGGRSLQRRLRTLVLKLLLRWDVVDAKLQESRRAELFGQLILAGGSEIRREQEGGRFFSIGRLSPGGISCIDPNINSSNFALSNLNAEGWEFNLAAYNFTDFLTGVLTFYYSYALHPNLYGGYATGNVLMPTGQPYPCQEQITQNIHNRQPRHLAEVLRIALRRAVHAKSRGHSSVCRKLYA